jgi:hypothetical protein
MRARSSRVKLSKASQEKLLNRWPYRKLPPKQLAVNGFYNILDEKALQAGISFVYYSSRTEYSYAIRALTFELRCDMNPLGF